MAERSDANVGDTHLWEAEINQDGGCQQLSTDKAEGLHTLCTSLHRNKVEKEREPGQEARAV